MLDIMKLNITRPKQMKTLQLNIKQLIVIQFISELPNQTITTSELIEFKGCSSQAASMFLKELYSKGYLTRKPVLDPTGGIMYKYTLLEGLLS